MLTNLYSQLNELTKTDPSLCAILILALILAPVFIACYNLIIIPQKIAGNHINFVCNKIKQGDRVSTFNGNTGTILHVFRNTVILELESGCKTEVSKQSIKSIHKMPDKA